jgi:hypothetical protein
MMKTRLRRWLPLGTIVLATALAQPISNAVAGSEQADPNAAVATVKAGTATAAPAGLTNADAHTGNPTAAQMRSAEAAAAARPFAGPRPAAVAAAPLAQGPSSGASVDPQAEPVGLSIFRNTTIPSSGLSGGYANISPTTGEPSTDVNGKNVFQTGNWYATYSKNGGSTWTALNPFTIFGSGFCCDQITIYDSARDRWFWVLQYGDHLTIANSAGGSLTSWCSYNFTPQSIGAPTGAVYDYNDLALGTRFLYLTSNIFTSSGTVSDSSAVLRLPLSEMITCSNISYNFIRRTTEFTYKAATGSGDTALIASNNLDSGTGTTLRIFKWPESSTSFTIFNRAVSAFTYMTRNGGQSCGSADGVVNNWCNFADSRVLGGAKGGNLVAWSWNAKQSGTTRLKPYTRLTVLDARTLTVLSNEDVYNSANALQFMSIGADDRGHIGAVITEGGGSGTTHKYPSPVVFIRDDVDPSPGFAGVTVATGLGGGCPSTGGVIRWGDYQTSRAVETADGVFIGAGIRKIGTACTGANNPPRNFVYGRARSLPGSTRWSSL